MSDIHMSLEHRFAQFVQQQRHFIYHTALKMLHNQDEAEDVTQEVLLKVYTHLSHFRQQSSLSTWVYRITINSSIDAQNKIARQRQATLPYSCTEDKPCAETQQQPYAQRQLAEPEDYLLQLEQRTLVRTILAEMEAEKAQLLLLRYVAHMSTKEVAKHLGINMSAAKMRLLRAREDFQHRFSQYEAYASL